MNPPRPPYVFADADPEDDDCSCEPPSLPSRWEVSDTLEEDAVDAAALDGPEAQTLALRYGLDEALPAQATGCSQTVRAVILDTAAGLDWELNVLEFTAAGGWLAVSVSVPSHDAAGVNRAAAWLLRTAPPWGSKRRLLPPVPDDEDALGSTDAIPPGVHDPRTMSAAAFGLFRLLSPEERAALSRRKRFHTMPWLIPRADRPTDADDLLF